MLMIYLIIHSCKYSPINELYYWVHDCPPVDIKFKYPCFHSTMGCKDNALFLVNNLPNTISLLIYIIQFISR